MGIHKLEQQEIVTEPYAKQRSNFCDEENHFKLLIEEKLKHSIEYFIFGERYV